MSLICEHQPRVGSKSKFETDSSFCVDFHSTFEFEIVPGEENVDEVTAIPPVEPPVSFVPPDESNESEDLLDIFATPEDLETRDLKLEQSS